MIGPTLSRLFDWLRVSRRLSVVDGDCLPARLPWRDLVVVRDEGEEWSVGMRCPCTCGRVIELLLASDAEPRWDLAVDKGGAPTLSPSVWLEGGCASHFWVRKGQIEWCDRR